MAAYPRRTQLPQEEWAISIKNGVVAVSTEAMKHEGGNYTRAWRAFRLVPLHSSDDAVILEDLESVRFAFDFRDIPPVVQNEVVAAG